MTELFEQAADTAAATLPKRGRPKKSEPKVEAVPAVVQHPSEADAMVAMIERIIRDPSIDVSRIEKMIEMRERIVAHNAKAAFDAALSEMQPKLPVIDRKGRIVIREKGGTNVIQSTPYALWEDISEQIKPVMAAHGFAIRFQTGLADDGRVKVTGILSHREGHREESTMTLMHDSTGSKNQVQAIGSSTSYGKRYVACAMLNITSRGEDDDGKAAANDGPISDEEVEAIQKLIVEVGADIPRFLKYMKVEKIEEIPATQYQRAVDALNSKRAKA